MGIHFYCDLCGKSLTLDVMNKVVHMANGEYPEDAEDLGILVAQMLQEFFDPIDSIVGSVTCDDCNNKLNVYFKKDPEKYDWGFGGGWYSGIYEHWLRAGGQEHKYKDAEDAEDDSREREAIIL